MIEKRKNFIDITGQKFGRLTAIGIDDTKKTKKTYWICVCECGTIKSVRSDSLKDGSVVSCGCKKREQEKINLTTHYDHMQSGTRIYYIWQGMKARCENIHNPRYHNYGGRGIVVCDEWKNNFNSFFKWATENGYSKELTIDRIDVNGNYEPNNCRWADIKVQCNNRTSNIKITIGNATKSLKEWCEIFEVDYAKIHARYQRDEFISVDDLFNR